MNHDPPTSQSSTGPGGAGPVQWLGKGDLNAFWALFADNLANMLIIGAVLTAVIGVPADIVFGRVLPGAAVALLVGLAVYARMAWRLAKETGRSDVTALPYGISTPVLFVYLFAVILPVRLATGDPVAAWQVGMAAAFAGGILEACGALFGPWLKRHLPRAGMLGTLAGIALAFIATVPMAEIFEDPVVGLPAMALILVGLVAGRRLPFGVPAGLAAIIVGTAIGLATGESTLTGGGLELAAPVPLVGDLLSGFQLMVDNPWVLGVVIPVEIYNFIETMNNVESAEAAGDAYPVGTCQVVDGLGTMAGALCGSAFPTTVYIGHPGYKKLGARGGYALGVGVVFFIAAMVGILPWLSALIPIAAIAPILVFVGIVITAQAFSATPARHGVAVALAMVPHGSALLVVKWGALAAVAPALLDAAGNRLALADPALLEAMLGQGAHVQGHLALAGGAILVGLAWGSIAAFLIDGALGRAALVSGVASLLTLVGVIHGSNLGLHTGPLFWGYVVLTAVLLLLAWFPAPAGEADQDAP